MQSTVQQRVATTMGFFGFGVSATSIIAYHLRNSTRFAGMHWLPLLGGIALTSMATMGLSYERMLPLKVAAFTGFCGMEALLVLPFVQIASPVVIGQAAIATGVTFASLATVSMMAPSEHFLKHGGALGWAVALC